MVEPGIQPPVQRGWLQRFPAGGTAVPPKSLLNVTAKRILACRVVGCCAICDGIFSLSPFALHNFGQSHGPVSLQHRLVHCSGTLLSWSSFRGRCLLKAAICPMYYSAQHLQQILLYSTFSLNHGLDTHYHSPACARREDGIILEILNWWLAICRRSTSSNSSMIHQPHLHSMGSRRFCPTGDREPNEFMMR